MDVESHAHTAAMASDQEYTKGFQVDASVPAKYRGEVSMAVENLKYRLYCQEGND